MPPVGRLISDPAAWNGMGFPFVADLNLAGTLASYVSGVAGIFVPPSFGQERHGYALSLADVQAWYQSIGVSGTGTDNFRIQLIDQTADIAGAGTVTTVGTAVTGSGTAFLTAYSVGSYIRSTGNTFKITAIADDTHLTLEAAPGSNWSAAAHFKVPTLSTLATISVAANAKFSVPTDVRLSKKALPLKPGQGIRIDVAAIGASYSPAPANITLNLAFQSYGLDG